MLPLLNIIATFVSVVATGGIAWWLLARKDK